MFFIDTHSHIYSEEYDSDRENVIEESIKSGVNKILLPAIDKENYKNLFDCCNTYPDTCFPMIGLHPTSVNPETIDEELNLVKETLYNKKVYAIGEIGIDLYWDKTHAKLQEDVFRLQLNWAKENNLPVSIHIRNSFNEVWRILKKEFCGKIQAVLHCYPGNIIQAKDVVDCGFYLGIGGVITFKNSTMQDVVKEIGINYLVLETDAPYLTPSPHRGKRNHPSYIPIIAQKVADLTDKTLEEVARITTSNAKKIFALS